MQPYPQPPYPGYPPPKPGLPTWAIVLIVLGLGGAGLIGLAVVGAVVAVRMARDAGAPTVDPTRVVLSESYKTDNGLMTAHYPPDFAAKKLDNVTILLARNLPDGSDEALTLGAVPDPITDDLHEFARILLNIVAKNVEAKGGSFVQTGERPSNCLGPHTGLEVDTTFKLPTSVMYHGRSCFFMVGKVGYEVRYDVPQVHEAQEVPLLERIVGATELAK